LRATSRRRRPAWPRRLGWGLSGLSAACGAWLILTAVIPDPDDGTARPWQTKGNGWLTVFRERGGRVDEVVSGDRLQPGDRLRFQVDPLHPGQVMVVGVEDSKRLFAYFPLDGSDTSRAVVTDDPQLLPGAAELDSSAGSESIHAVLCPQPFALADLRWHQDKQRLQLPDGCISDSLVAVKAPR
jgi:hypothetical protein